MPDAGEETGPEVVVVDASAVVAIVASRSSSADRLAVRLRDASLHAPQLLPTEVDSALRGLVLGRRLTAAQATAARRGAAGLPIELWPWAVVAERAWELRTNISTYDAGYIALAERLGATLVTADARRGRATGARCVIEVHG